jgi:hypothetical protein
MLMKYAMWSILQKSAMRNNKFVKIVIWIVVLLVIAGLALPVFTSFLGF